MQELKSQDATVFNHDTTPGTANDGEPNLCFNGASPIRLPEDQAYARRWEIVQEITARLQESGLNIPTDGGKQFEFILAMTLNAFVPEYSCTILDPHKKARLVLYPGGKNEVWNPPDIALQQKVCKHFRDDPGLQDVLAENFALSLYLGGPLFWMGDSAIELRNDGLIQAGGERFHTLTNNSGTVFIPGCGLTSFRMIQEFLAKQKQSQGEGIHFLLCDNHPFVADVASRYCRYFADNRVEFHAASMESVALPEDTRTVFLSYVEAAGDKAIAQMLSNLKISPNTRVVLVAGVSPNEYSDLAGKDVVRLCEEAGFSSLVHSVCPSFSTHLVVNGRSVDFVDLNSAQALYVFSLGLNGQSPNSKTLIHSFCKASQ